MKKNVIERQLMDMLGNKYGLQEIEKDDNLFSGISGFSEMEMVFFLLDIMKKFEILIDESDLKEYRFITVSNIADVILEHIT